MKASIYSIRKKKPSSIVVAVPVGPPETIEELKKEVNRVICLIVFKPFFAIGQFYEDFTQVSDEEVVKILKISKFIETIINLMYIRFNRFLKSSFQVNSFA